MSFNRVILMGNLTRDPGLRTVGTGSAVCDLGIALNRKYKTQSGEMKEEVTFVDVAVWGRQGENVKRYLSKGDPVLVEGRLKFDSWQAQDGSRRSKLSVVAENVRFLPRGGRGGGMENGEQQQGDHFADQRYQPAAPAGGAMPFGDSPIPEDDVPF